MVLVIMPTLGLLCFCMGACAGASWVARQNLEKIKKRYEETAPLVKKVVRPVINKIRPKPRREPPPPSPHDYISQDPPMKKYKAPKVRQNFYPDELNNNSTVTEQDV